MPFLSIFTLFFAVLVSCLINEKRFHLENETVFVIAFYFTLFSNTISSAPCTGICSLSLYFPSSSKYCTVILG